jgi:hypothetical protein
MYDTIAVFSIPGLLEGWKDGVMERYNLKPPLFHLSNTPLILFESYL